MAQRQHTVYIDDLTGKEPAAEQHETVNFGLDGVHDGIDLDTKAADKLRNALATYVAHGRRLTATGRAVRRTQAAAHPSAVRAWAASQGIAVNSRGRVPAGVVEHTGQQETRASEDRGVAEAGWFPDPLGVHDHGWPATSLDCACRG